MNSKREIKKMDRINLDETLVVGIEIDEDETFFSRFDSAPCVRRSGQRITSESASCSAWEMFGKEPGSLFDRVSRKSA